MRRTIIAFCKRTALTLATVVLCSSAGCSPSDDSALEETSDQRYPIDPTVATISITNRDGSIRIYGAGGDGREVRVAAVKKAYTPERLKAISVQVSAEQGSISINTIYPPDSSALFSDHSGTVDYVIVVPQAARISKLELNNGEVQIEEMRSKEAHARLGSGRFLVHNCFGNLDIGIQTGNLALVYEWWEEGDFSIRAHVEDGNSFACFPGEAVFHLIAHTATGKVASDFEEQERRQEEPTNQIDQMVGGAEKPKIEIETNDGNIKIAEHTP